MHTRLSSLSVYVHIPFCRARCAYCDFNTYAGLESLLPRYVAALCREVELAGNRWGDFSLATVYFGGGTPSLMTPEMVERVLNALSLAFCMPPDVEITLEANPGTVDGHKLRQLRSLGVNRLSLGAQSAHDAELRLLGRIHTWGEVVATVQEAREAGFANLSLDFIFGLPGQTLERWQETLEAALGLAPEHLSLYALTVEEGTPLWEQIEQHLLPAPDDDLAAGMYEYAEERLAAAGYSHYEISNWAREGYACRHNLTYWHNEPWLGVGAGAHSWLDGRRWANLSHPEDYIRALERGEMPVAEHERIELATEMGETMMLWLRLAEGADALRFRERFGVELEAVFGGELAELCEVGLLEWDGRVARLTPRGRLLGNQVFLRFI
ncbi:MAG: radical SAM family heme chaperone HemW [Anaerolineae bacterium]|nr:radical SAM family heme chaperone HemW [Anaerolineae bacterium]